MTRQLPETPQAWPWLTCPCRWCSSLRLALRCRVVSTVLSTSEIPDLYNKSVSHSLVHAITHSRSAEEAKENSRQRHICVPLPPPLPGTTLPLPTALWQLPTYPAQGMGRPHLCPRYTHMACRITQTLVLLTLHEHQTWQVNMTCMMGWAGLRSGHPHLHLACVPSPIPGGERPHLLCPGCIWPALCGTSKRKEVLCDSQDGKWGEGRRGTGSRCGSAQSVNPQPR